MEAILWMPSPLTALPKGVKGVTKVTFVLRKSLSAKTGVTSHLSVPEYGIINASNFKFGITPGSNPQKGVTQLTFIYLKTPRVNPMTYRSLVFPESLTHSLIWRPSRVAHTPPLLPISRYGYCPFVADVCLCSEVLQPGGSWSSSGSGSM